MRYIIALGGVLAVLATGGLLWIANYLPTMNQVVDFATEQTPELIDTFSGAGVPDGSTTPVEMSNKEVPTTFPVTPEAQANGASAGSALEESPAWLTPDQRRLLDTFGVDVEMLPTTLTPTLKACLESAWGSGRLTEIMQGSTPTVFEGAKAVSCL